MKKVEQSQMKVEQPHSNRVKIGLFLASVIVGVALALASLL
jgi:hypothetical protein